MEENKQMFDLRYPWTRLSEAASTMTVEEFEKHFMENFELRG